MASTSVHFPRGLLDELDRAAKEAGTSRNRLIVDSCRALLRRRRRDWPDDFFRHDHLTDEELQELRAGAEDFVSRIAESRHNRAESPF